MKRSLVWAIFILCASSGYGQEARPISLAQAVAMALEHSYAMKLQDAERDRTAYQYREALAGVLPQLSANGSMQKYIESPQLGGMSFNKEYETSYGITVTQPLYRFGAIQHALNAAESSQKIQDIKKEIVRKDVVYATRLSYFTVKMAEKQLDIARGSLENAKANLSILQRQFSGGRPPRSDLIRINADIARRVPQVTTAESQLEIAFTRLKILLGVDPNRPIVCSTPLSDQTALDTQLEIPTELADLPQLQVLDQTIKLQDNVAKVKRTAQYPALGAFYNYSMQRQSDSGPFEPERNNPTSAIGLSLTWDIWDGGGNRARYHQALVDKSKAETSLAQEREKISTELLVIKKELASVRSNLESTRKAITLAKQSFEMSQQRFRSGRTSVLELNDTESALTQARLNESQLVFQLNQLVAKWSMIVEGAHTKGESHE